VQKVLEVVDQGVTHGGRAVGTIACHSRQLDAGRSWRVASASASDLGGVDVSIRVQSSKAVSVCRVDQSVAAC